MFENAHFAATLPVTDLDRAIRFYADTLGLKRLEVPDPEMASEVSLFEANHGSRILLYCQTSPSNGHHDHTAASFWVEDFEATLRKLEDRGVSMEHYDTPELRTDARGVVTRGQMQSAWFKDPEGNILNIVG
jgi:catechol 2,3-dioxygenase-like lactoylglutathione lyase family enzyme